MDNEVFTDEEWALVQILQNPVMFRDFINEGRPNWSAMEDHERAWSSCTAPYLCMCCGRGVRKTESMIELLYYWMVNGMYIPGDPGLLVFVPNKAQKDAIWPRIRQACESHWLMSKFADPNKMNEQVGRIEFRNGFTFILRIAGSENKESNVISIHTSRIWVDEAQDFPWKAWQSLGNVLKFDVPGHMLWVSGVPNGERENNALFKCDQQDSKYITFNIGQPQMSWWTPELEMQRREEYDSMGELTENYKHFVLGQHGVPTFSLFDRTRFLRENYDLRKVILTQKNFDNTKRINPDGNYSYHINEAVDCPTLPIYPGNPKVLTGVGYDVGYSPDPAVFFIMYRDPITGIWRNLVRYRLERVEYPIQAETLYWLDTVYNFDFMGIDFGGVGKPQYQILTGEVSDQKYKDRKYNERLFPVEFGGRMTVSVVENNNEVVEKKDNVKKVAVETLSRWVHEHRFAFSVDDTDLMSELERTRYSRTINGEAVYRTGDDHQMAAFMCAIMAYEDNFGVPLSLPKYEIRPKLLSARWLSQGAY